MKNDRLTDILRAVHSDLPVQGLTHQFYRYPARFSPLVAKAVIKAFTNPGDIVFDPFMGGGTTVVEARALGRRVIGCDINSLAFFVSKVKTSLITNADRSVLQKWGSTLDEKLLLNNRSTKPTQMTDHSYQRNISGRDTWPIRKSLELVIAAIGELPKRQHESFARCVLLKTAQWALDCRGNIPSVREFRDKFYANLSEMLDSGKDFTRQVRAADRTYTRRGSLKTVLLQRSAIGIEKDKRIRRMRPVKLVLTSPPYPGVHVLYHRWQVNGRKETPAPYWVINSLDGQGASYYTFGDRQEQGLKKYYGNAEQAFSSIVQYADKTTVFVQLVAFSDPSWQLPRYLNVMERAGLTEDLCPDLANRQDGRLWREIPNRKWYAHQKGQISSSQEVVLFHKLK